MRLVLVGIPGSGKSTQGNLLSKKLKIPYLSTGHIFRHLAKERTPQGRYIKAAIASGKLINDKKTIEIVSSYLSKSTYKSGFILDGFPRNLFQAESNIIEIDKVIYLKLSDKEALWRMAERESEEREDDRVAVVKDRIELFHEITKPLISYYESKSKLIEIDCERTIEEINDDILSHLGSDWIDQHLKNTKLKKPTIILITGLPGSGKSEAIEYFKGKNHQIISFSSIVNDLIDKKGLENNLETNIKIRSGLRAEFGMQAMAILSLPKIKNSLLNDSLVFVDGYRSYDELLCLQKEFSDATIVTIALWAPKKVRYSRIELRNTRNKLFGEERDISEIMGLNMGPSIALADYMIQNDKSIEELHTSLEDIYREVYFV